MQITRQRVRPETQVDMREVCPACHGTGTVTPAALLDEQIENQIAYFRHYFTEPQPSAVTFKVQSAKDTEEFLRLMFGDRKGGGSK